MRFTVLAPATTANLGPGFDCAGAAFDLWNELHVEPADFGVPLVTLEREGVDELLGRSRRIGRCAGPRVVWRRRASPALPGSLSSTASWLERGLSRPPRPSPPRASSLARARGLRAPVQVRLTAGIRSWAAAAISSARCGWSRRGTDAGRGCSV